MKKYKTYLIVVIIIMIIPFIYKMTIKHKETNYKINKYQIEEIFNINNKKHTYEFNIKKGKNIYSYKIENNIHKNSKIIKKIKEYKQDNITCIVPIYKNTKELEIYCNLDKQQVSKEYLRDNDSFKEILKKVKKYNISLKDNKETNIDYKNITIYSKNIPSNYKVIIWNYKGIVIIDNEKNIYKEFRKEDLYDNVMATTTKRYFTLFENTSVAGVKKIHCYDLIKDKYKLIELETYFNKDSYINGVVDNTIYVTDKKDKKQYAINIKKETIKEVGNEELQYIKYHNYKNELLPKREFLSKEQFFNNERITNNKVTKSKDLVEEDNIYYYKEDNTFYEQLKNRNKVLLFESEAKEWNVFDKDIVFKNEEYLYLYNDNIGLRKLISYNELNYNDNNIYFIWRN